jgi:pimeloyl-ACP methyl ester carboxylesterase
MLWPVVAVLALAPVAATYENISVVRDQHTYAAPGTSYWVHGHRLYLDCRGQGSPTVVLDNGLGEVTASWARIVGQVDTATRVCAYDRAGQGWSQDTSSAQDGVAAAQDLHILLDLAGEHGPYLLVGHSIGGTYALTYADQYPQQVAGMVLLDSSSPEQFTAIPSYSGQYALVHRVMALTPTLNRLGLGRVFAAVATSHLPSDAAGKVTALTASAHGARSASGEWQVLPTLFKQAQQLTTFGNRPLAVLTASESAQKTEGWTAAQNRLAALSSRSVHQVVDSSHMGLLEDQHGSAAAVTAIDHVIAAVRSKSQGTR